MLATQVTASWRYRSTDVSWGTNWSAAFEALTSAFSDTYSYSLQQTLFAMGKRIVETVPAICEVQLALPNRHHFLVDLAPFGETNENVTSTITAPGTLVNQAAATIRLKERTVLRSFFL